MYTGTEFVVYRTYGINTIRQSLKDVHIAQFPLCFFATGTYIPEITLKCQPSDLSLHVSGTMAYIISEPPPIPTPPTIGRLWAEDDGL